ncbi:MAG: ATP-binding protein [Salinisphaeraceae bacterium]|nr:ATP-binding protein [Salinisphaeraceae bacterium]
MNSLRARLIAASGVVLMAFVAFTGLALERAVRERAQLAQRDKMQGLIYALLGNADIDNAGQFGLPPGELPEAALTRPESGLYAMVLDGERQPVWRSPSLLEPVSMQQLPAVGETLYARTQSPRDEELITLAFGIRWVVDSGDDYRYTLIVAEDATPLRQQMQRFRGVLWLWLVVAVVILLLLQTVILRWGLSPLRRVSRSLANIESGEKSRIDGDYPDEIQPLVNNLNAMLASEQQRLKRYRNALGDLAHSLKTPIAVLRGLSVDKTLPDEHRRQLDQQVGRVNEIVDYQLQRAAAAGKRALAPQLALAPVVQKMAGALRKVYREEGTRFAIDIPADISLPIDEGDLTEVLGNLMDNAAKYGGGRVRVSASRKRGQVDIMVDDDGPGFPEDAEKLLLRGARADSRREGQGIGLSVAAEIVEACNGRLALGRSDAGGGRVALSFATH